MGNLQAPTEEIVRVWESLRTNWDETRQAWKDSDRDRFEQEYILEFDQAINTYIASLRRLADVVQRIENEMP
jgi:hypothetical protein